MGREKWWAGRSGGQGEVVGNEVEEAVRAWTGEVAHEESWRPLDIRVFECIVYRAHLCISDSKGVQNTLCNLEIPVASCFE